MRNLPLDAEAFKAQVLAAVEVVEDVDYQTKAQKISQAGQPVWKIRLLTRDGVDETRKPDITEVKVPAAQRPAVVPGVIPSFGGLVGIVWSGDSGGGVSLRAETVAMGEAPSAARPKTSEKTAA
ncbi:MAG: hypothetical protein AAGA93_06125 [Actinomycetota bacterium]